MSEAVNHPQHYQKEGRKECIKEMEELFGVYQTCIFALLSAYKYIYRAGEKEGNTRTTLSTHSNGYRATQTRRIA